MISGTDPTSILSKSRSLESSRAAYSLPNISHFSSLSLLSWSDPVLHFEAKCPITFKAVPSNANESLSVVPVTNPTKACRTTNRSILLNCAVWCTSGSWTSISSSELFMLASNSVMACPKRMKNKHAVYYLSMLHSSLTLKTLRARLGIQSACL